jgi:hypothetical protein
MSRFQESEGAELGTWLVQVEQPGNGVRALGKYGIRI